MAYYYRTEVVVQIFQWFPLIPFIRGQMTLLMPNGMKFLAPYLAFYDTILVVEGSGLDRFVIAWQGWKSRLTLQSC